MADKVISRHFVKRRAHLAATDHSIALRRAGRSSGWGKLDVRVIRATGLRLRRWVVVER